MNPSTLQFLVAGALIAAWAWMLGRPILLNLFRRSRRDSVGHFRYQQAVLGRPLDDDLFPRRRSATQTAVHLTVQPVRNWRAQPRERRRLQVMMGFSFATFFALLLAIALRGSAIRLFLVMATCFVAYLCYAAAVGAAILRRQDQTIERRRVDEYHAADVAEEGEISAEQLVDRLYGEPVATVQSADEPQLSHRSEPTDDYLPVDDFEPVPVGDPFDGSEGFGTGNFDDEFFEPIPELQFAPLNLDASLISPAEEEQGHEPSVDADEPAAKTILEDDYREAESEDVLDGVTLEAGDVDNTDRLETASGPSFTTPPPPRPRSNRRKARPIYREAQADGDGDSEQRVVND